MTQPRYGLEETLENRRDAIMALPGVLGVGLSRCDGEPCVKVLADQSSAHLEHQLDRLLAGHRFVIERTDPIRAYPRGR